MLFGAVKTGNEAVVDLLLKAGADPNSGDLNGQTPLMIAASMGFEGICAGLLAAGGNPSLKDGSGNTACDLASNREIFYILSNAAIEF